MVKNNQPICDKVTISEPEPSWYKKDGVIYFSVTSDGTSSEGWIDRLKSKGIIFDDSEKSVLRSSDFQPTKGFTYEIAILKGDIFKGNNSQFTENIRAEADKRGFTTPNAEIACLIFEKFSYKELEAMDLLGIVPMHYSIKDSGGLVGHEHLLCTCVGRHNKGVSLGAYFDHPIYPWNRKTGFAFVQSASQVSA